MNNFKNLKSNKGFGWQTFILSANNQKCIFRKHLFILICVMFFIVFLSAYSNAVFGQDCDTEKTVAEKTKLANDAKTTADKLAQAFKSLPPAKPKPAENKNGATAKADLDAAKIKWDKSKDALNDAKKNLKPGSDETSMKQDIANKQRELDEKQEELKNKDTKTYNDNRSKIAELQGEFRSTIKDFKRSTAGEIISNMDYKKIDFSKSAIANCTGQKAKQLNASEDMVRGECYLEKARELLNTNNFKGELISQLSGELQNAVTAIGSFGTVSSTRKESPNETISRAGPLLQTEIEKTQTALREKYAEYVKLDNGIGILMEQINALRTEINTLEGQLKPITEAEKKANDAKNDFEKAEKKWKDAEKNSQDIKDWEAADTKRKKAEKEMNDAAAEKTKADMEKANAEKADAAFKTQATTALNTAQTEAALNTLDARMATLNRDLLREAAREVVANNATVIENKKKLEQAKQKPNITEPQKAELDRRWRVYLRPIVQPHYIRKRNEAEANRLRGIRDATALQNVKCVKEVNVFIIELNQAINKVLALTASLATDGDFRNPNEERVEIPDDLLPPLEEKGGGESPTDEVPDDIEKNTGKVKVDEYYVFLLTNASNGLYIGTIESMKTSVRCSFTGGGIGCKPTDLVTYKKLLGPFASSAEAQNALCKSITESKFRPAGIGWMGRWQGSNNWYGLWDVSLSSCPPK